MSDKKKYNKDREDFLRYSGKKMHGKERNAFERRLQKDEFDAEAAEGYEKISPTEAGQDLDELDRRLRGRSAKDNRFLYLRIAAAVVFLLMVSGLFYYYSERRISDNHSKLAITEDAEREETAEQPVLVPDSVQKQDRLTEEFSDSEKPVKARTKSPDLISHRDGTKARKDLSETISVAEDREPITDSKMAVAEKEVTDDIVMDIPQESISQKKTKYMATDQASREPIVTEGPIAEMEIVQPEKNASPKMESERSELKGKIVSAENDLPLPGVSVVVKGTTRGTVTDLEGEFTIPVEKDTNLTLVASYIGMQKEEFRLNTRQSVIIDLEPDDLALDEVVVTGYGTQKKKNVTGAVSEIDMDSAPENADYNPPYPEDGKKAFNEYLKENLRFPANDSLTTKAVVVIKFTVTANGKLKDFEVVRAPSEYYSKEAIRLVRKGPSWKPASRDGEVYEDRTRLRIVFNR